MKTKIKTLSVAILLSLSVLSAQASLRSSIPIKEFPSSQKVSAEIKNVIHLPEEFFTLGFHEKVKVLFLVTANGSIENVLCVTANPQLKSSIETQFTKMNFSSLKEKTLYSININFTVN